MVNAMRALRFEKTGSLDFLIVKDVPENREHPVPDGRGVLV